MAGVKRRGSRTSGQRPDFWRSHIGSLESLESRRLLAASIVAGLRPLIDPATNQLVFDNTLPDSHSLWDPNGTLTRAGKSDPLSIALNYLNSHATDLGLSAADIGTPIVTDQYKDSLTGESHIYLQQQVNHIPVVNANLTVNVLSDGSILSVAGGFVSGVNKYQGNNPAPLISSTSALRVAGAQLALTSTNSLLRLTVSKPATGVNQLTSISAPQLSLDSIPERLVYVPSGDGLQLAWDMVLRTPDGNHWYDVAVGDHAGQVVFANDWTDHASYNVVPFPRTSPDDGPASPNRQLVNDPPDPLASPYGWHDTNGVAGPEFTTTVGNNVSAQEDVDHNDTGGFRPDGGPGLNFDFPLDLTKAPSTYQSAAITNLFYWNNLLHDIHYHYGFTEAAGDFQTNTYGRGGIGNDAVQADAQDGSGTNNANFSTPPDGTPGRMQMYLFNYTSPNRDGDLDNGIIIHEYGHGVSNRLTGGPANANALDATQSGGMGEGWSDWWALMLTQTAADTQNGGYGIGNYVFGQPATGSGFRRVPYSYDMAIDPLTIDAYGTSGIGGGVSRSTEEHNSGEIWCSALWDMNWLLINKYGYSSNIAAGYDPATGNDKGNQLALRLVMDALKIQPANPSFKQARDAILQADIALTGGANQQQIWQAFARRGMGNSFVNGSSSDSSVTPAYDVPFPDPLVVSTSLPANGFVISPMSFIDFNFNQPMNTSSFSIADDVLSFTGPGNTDRSGTITGYTWLDADTLRINFSQITQFGAYSMKIGPNILAADNDNPMDQDQDGILGEIPADSYTASFTYTTSIGPDGFGYRAAQYPFENIDLVPGAVGVTSMLDNVDDVSSAINLGANTFNFYGTNYSASQLFVSSNGLVTFATASTSFTNGTLSSTPNPRTIAPYWDDWVTDNNTTAAGAANDIVLYKFEDTTGDSVADRLVIEWSNVFHVLGAPSPVTFQLILQLNTGATPGRIIFNYVDLDAGAAANNNGASQTEGIKSSGAQGANRLLIAANGTSSWVGSGKAIVIGLDVEPPAVTSESFDVAAAQQTIRLTFSEDVGVTLSTADLVLENLTDPSIVLSANLALNYDVGTKTASITFPGYPAGTLPDGNYRLTILSGGVTDPVGNPLDGNADGVIGGNHTFDFFVLGGDANRDRIVDIKDLAILAANWQGTSRTFVQGDFNYDSKVDAADLGIVAGSWQKTLTPPPAPVAAIVPPPLSNQPRTPTRKAARVADLVLPPTA